MLIKRGVVILAAAGSKSGKGSRKAQTGFTSATAVPECVVRQVADFFSVLGDPTRVKIILCIASGETSVGDIAEAVGASDSAVSHQLRVLRNMRVVDYRKVGRMTLYSLRDEHIREILGQSIDHAAE